MPNSDKILRDAAYGPDSTPKGIEKTVILTSEDYYMNINNPETTPDPLAKNAKAANKPGSSIPSVFGRMIFFKTALRNARVRNSQMTVPSVYDKIVSEWLDLLEGIFTRSYRYKFIPWVKEVQLDRMRNTHTVLHEALETQMAKYFENRISTIFLIKDTEDKLIGATSPYTLVFTSPTYGRNKSNEIVPLINRNKNFRLFMYRLYYALCELPEKVKVVVSTINGQDKEEVPNPAYQMVESLCFYIKRNIDIEDAAVVAEIDQNNFSCVADLAKAYSRVEFDGPGGKEDVSIVNLSWDSLGVDGDPIHGGPETLGLYCRQAGEINSDFFVDPDEGHDQKGPLPLILPNVSIPDRYNKMKYIDDTWWKIENLSEVMNVENSLEEAIELPKGEGMKYAWLSAPAFLEDKLIKLPYLMDETKFKNVINIDFNSYLLPIKPKAFKYLSIHTILKGRNNQGEGFKWEYDKTMGIVSCRFDIPVSNKQRTRLSYVTLERSYDLVEDVVDASPNMSYPISIGISPFIQLPEEKENRYDVILHNGPLERDPVAALSLEFYDGSDKALERPIRSYPDFKASETVYQTLYKIMGTTFNAMRLKCDCVNMDPVGGIVIPEWEKPTDGKKEIYYAIDFGTTNTHIACVVDSVDAKSFYTEELKFQCVYLAKKENMRSREQYLVTNTTQDLKNACEHIYGDVSMATQEEEARRFFPNFELDQYSFPIRTASYGITEAEKEIFDGFSIGFNYPHEKERAFLDNYNTRLKWELERQTPESDHRAKLFFKELLMIVRNHWLKINNVDRTQKPKIALTFPLAMQAANLFTLWKEAYAEIFNVSTTQAENDYLIEVSESLAPAHKMISDGAYTTNGLLNVDIGGGTTDIQYYREAGGKKIALYNSEKFAGDDLWGCGRENLNVETTINENVFTRHADIVMEGQSIQIGTNTVPYKDLKDLRGKEKIGRLLQDVNGKFAANITSSPNLGSNTPALKVVFLHYAAILYHIAKWVKGHPRMKEKFPAVINFSGFGSKYIQILFGKNGNQNLTEFTRELLKSYGVEDIENLKVLFSETNPKGITAEGAAIYAKKKLQNGDVITPTKAYHYGYPGSDPKKSPTYGEAAEDRMLQNVMVGFDEYLSGFLNVQEKCNFEIPSLTKREREGFRKAAESGYNQIANAYLNEQTTRDNVKISKTDIKVQQSLFFWTLKDALYNFDQY